ncbi:hypothetical protein, partial [Staphylococcus pseudintermedius]|uniref:hypothetical protein n=1 Tax=Staphylococcus pseudintermedius TaxID=283734 RepID=UPI001C6F2C14
MVVVLASTDVQPAEADVVAPVSDPPFRMGRQPSPARFAVPPASAYASPPGTSVISPQLSVTISIRACAPATPSRMADRFA